MLQAPAKVPADLLAWLVAEYRLGELHKTLLPEAKWFPEAEHDVLRGQAQELLLVQGWRDRHGDLEREVVASLTVLCRPAEEFYGWIARDGDTIGVLAGRIGKETVLAVRHPDGTVWLNNINSTQMAARLVAQTPDVPAGTAKPFTVSPDEVRSTNRSGRQRTPSGVTVRRASAEARLAQRLAALPVSGYGELSTATRDQWGHRHRAEEPLRYADTTDGRVATVVTTVAGQSQVRVEPASRDSMIRILTRMHRSLPG
ncbi:ESX secretion-associated protein EspG [Actinophytocola sp.]|uniref:ESX secretion-associated protein EspG n=1 Tax=Actinophytocola sp. TaxID=1872138 RepID=UPI0025BAF49E|nr:ESX secretion-associated protein EspG [Actinophytocola sp.]